MADEQAVVADSAPVAETAPREVVEQPDVTHGDAAAQATTPPADDSTADTGPEPDEPDDPETEPSEEDSPEEAKSKAEKRRERRRAKEQERIQASVDAEIARREREREVAAQAQARTEAAQKATRERTERLQQFVGVPDAPDRPGTVTVLSREIEDLNRQIRQELVTPTGQVDIDQLAQSVSEKEATRGRLTENTRMAGEIENFVWDQIGDGFMSALAFPELADDAAKQRYRQAQGGIPGALAVLREAIRSAALAEKDAEIKAQADRHQAQLRAIEADRNAWRVRAGGSEVPDTTSGGSPLAQAGALTRSDFLRLPKDQKDRMRREQPSLVAEIYSRSA